MSAGNISIRTIIDVYVLLRENIDLTFFGSTENISRELAIDVFLDCLAGYDNSIGEIEISRPFDFTDGWRDDERLQLIFGHTESVEVGSAIRSFNKITRNDDTGKFDTKIYLDISNNRCWRRFCIVKEACHTILLAGEDALGIDYPRDVGSQSVLDLIQALNNLPFSVNDFDSEQYSPSLAIENAAEVLAFLLLMAHENIASKRELLSSEQYVAKPLSFDFLGVAEQFMVPRRYTELFLQNKILGQMIGKIQEALGNTPFSVVPPPRPKPVDQDDKSK